MASASHALLRSLLRQSDRRPIGHLDGVDLGDADVRLIERLLAGGVLREIRRVDRVDDLAVTQDGLGSWALSVDGDEADQEIDPRSLRQFEIDPSALAAFIASAAGIARPVEQVDRQLTSLGRLEHGATAASVFLAWHLRDHSVQMIGRSIRQLVPAGPVILLTPTLRDLGLEASRARDERGIRQAAVDALLPADPTAELHLDLSTVLHGRLHAKPRLVIRQKARSVMLDGTNVVVPPQPFDLLVLLADRALEDSTHANRRYIETRERNEALDCYVYARAAAAIVGLDRMNDRHWRQRAAELGAQDPAPTPLAGPTAEPVVPSQADSTKDHRAERRRGDPWLRDVRRSINPYTLRPTGRWFGRR
jgi:hypothetical protein